MRSVFFVLALSALVFTGCKGDGAPAANQNAPASPNAAVPEPPKPIAPTSQLDPNFKSCNPYMPLVPGSSAKYTVVFSSGLVADATVVVDQVEENGQQIFKETTQIVDRSGGLNKIETTIRKYACDGGRVKLISESTDNRIEGNQNLVENKFRGEAIAMLDPASLGRKGSRWSYSYNQTFQTAGRPPRLIEDPRIIEFEVIGSENVRVPAGEFPVVRVRRSVGDVNVFDLYSPGLGLVRRQNQDGTTWELREFAGLSPQA